MLSLFLTGAVGTILFSFPVSAIYLFPSLPRSSWQVTFFPLLFFLLVGTIFMVSLGHAPEY